jgi:hypothetical protein
MDAATRQFVRDRALNRCEYCHIPQEAAPLITFHVEHILAKQHLVDDSLANLALACDRCNAFKGPNLSSIDQEDGAIVALFHPRLDEWSQNFRFNGATIVGISPGGRATVRLLEMNAKERVALRVHWLAEGGRLS